MVRVFVSAIAESDRSKILTYLAINAGYGTAERYNAAFRAIFRRLADFPDSGPRRPALGPSVRVAVAHPFVVIYDHAEETVTILRIVHGKRAITGDLLRQQSGL